MSSHSIYHDFAVHFIFSVILIWATFYASIFLGIMPSVGVIELLSAVKITILGGIIGGIIMTIVDELGI